ncbi:MAG: DUF4080 domain-containing protein [Christensenellaceae bacterium]|nr:DUF4080 domain-containing protein [Christensenellaceae bacterium]
MKTVLLVAINAKYAHTNPAVRYLCKAANRSSVRFCEYTINMKEEDILRHILEQAPAACCFSTYIWNIRLCKRLAARLKEKGIFILMGGPEATYSYASLLEEGAADQVMLGEGESAFPAWVDQWEKEKNWAEVPSLAYLSEGSICKTPMAQPVRLDDLPQPYEDLSGLKGRIVYYESSRGCPFRCSYCLSSIHPGVRMAGVEKVMADLDAFRDAGIMKVKFVDRTFNADPHRAKEIFRRIIEKGGRTGFHFEIAADLLDEETAHLLAKAPAGLIQLEIGVQSTYEPTLKAIRRRQDFAHNAKMVDIIRRGGGVNLHLDLIAGLPLEDLQNFGRSFDDVIGTRAQQVQLGFLKVLKGSAMEKDAGKYGICWSDKAPYEVQKTDSINAIELGLLHRVEYLLDRTYNSGLFVNAVRGFGQHFGSCFAMYLALDKWLEEQQIDAHGLKEGQLAEALLQFGQTHGVPFARDLVRLDVLSRSFRPRLPDLLEDDDPAHAQLRREFFAALPPEEMPLLPRGKRPWHFARLEWFSMDVAAWEEKGELCACPQVLLFDYTTGQKKNCPNDFLFEQPL